ncbi:hypothetical protein LSG25_00925 [Paralcaligenes sp. KSB-10]|jgi:hypothetical protein|uniref:hypothetical protein n=1 Tax=Paralcaligenes sp. KSB-10 TaxID=2901142 RepID=UPI001E317C15|nr:hypothetical protein [Paralcaligenes sp. KSB-10]UHL64512.1 hypothetical protein LSG25_00925 [Paralcaligenes sp. KSB-10]
MAQHMGPHDGDYAKYIENLGKHKPVDTPGTEEPVQTGHSIRAGKSPQPGKAAGKPAARVDSGATLKAPRRIGILLSISAYVLLFAALRQGIHIMQTSPASIDDWIPVGFMLIAARLLLGAGRAARNPRTKPQDPGKSFPEHVDY